MSISLITVSTATIYDGSNEQGLISQLNTLLSPLLTARVRGVSFSTQPEERLIGNELQVTLTYDLSGSTMAAGFVAVAFQDKTPEAVQSAIQSFVAAHPGYFFSTVWMQAVALPRHGTQIVGLLFYNTSATDGAANWIVNGAPAVAVTTGNTLWVDAVNGNDATGTRGLQTKPFLTVQAAINAASAGDAVEVRPGTYVQGLFLKDRVGIHLLEGTVLSPDNSNNILFQDNGSTVRTVIGGEGRLLSAQGGDVLARFEGNSDIVIRCRECIFGNAGARGLWINAPATVFFYVDGLAQFSGDAATITSNAVVHMRAGQITIGGSGNGFNLSGFADVRIETDLLLTAAQVFYVQGVCQAYIRAWQIISTGNVVYVTAAGNGSSMYFDCDEIFCTGIGFRSSDGALPANLGVRARRVACNDRVVYALGDAGSAEFSFECETIVGMMEFGGNNPGGSIRITATRHSVTANHCLKCHMLTTFWVDVADLFVEDGADVSPITIGANLEASIMHIAGGRIAAPVAGGASSPAFDIYSTVSLIFDGATTLRAGSGAASAINVVDAAAVNVDFNANVTMNKPLDGHITVVAQPVTVPSAGGADLLTGQTVWVDAVNGNDGTAVRGDASKPYLSINAAATAALAGDTIDVRPGSYAVTGPLAHMDGRILYCEAGAVIDVPAGLGFLIDDGGAAIATKVLGKGKFTLTGVVGAVDFGFVTQSADSTIEFEFDDIVLTGNLDFHAWPFRTTDGNGKLIVRGTHIDGTASTNGDSIIRQDALGGTATQDATLDVDVIEVSAFWNDVLALNVNNASCRWRSMRANAAGIDLVDAFGTGQIVFVDVDDAAGNLDAGGTGSHYSWRFGRLVGSGSDTFFCGAGTFDITAGTITTTDLHPTLHGTALATITLNVGQLTNTGGSNAILLSGPAQVYGHIGYISATGAGVDAIKTQSTSHVDLDIDRLEGLATARPLNYSALTANVSTLRIGTMIGAMNVDGNVDISIENHVNNDPVPLLTVQGGIGTPGLIIRWGKATQNNVGADSAVLINTGTRVRVMGGIIEVPVSTVKNRVFDVFGSGDLLISSGFAIVSQAGIVSIDTDVGGINVFIYGTAVATQAKGAVVTIGLGTLTVSAFVA